MLKIDVHLHVTSRWARTFSLDNTHINVNISSFPFCFLFNYLFLFFYFFELEIEGSKMVYSVLSLQKVGIPLTYNVNLFD